MFIGEHGVLRVAAVELVPEYWLFPQRQDRAMATPTNLATHHTLNCLATHTRAAEYSKGTEGLILRHVY